MKPIVNRIFIFAWLVSLSLYSLTSSASEASTAPTKTTPAQQVMTSIYPLALLLNSAWPQHLNAQHLVPANQSPHDFSLKPSDRRAIEQTPFLLWLGPELEPYLHKVLSSQTHHLALLPHADHHDDPHIWLAPQRIAGILKQVQNALQLPEPKAFLSALENWQDQSRRTFAPFKDKGFVVYHDAFSHWVKFFGLKQLASVTTDPDHPVGSRHLLEVREILETQAVSCLFTEPQFSSPIVRKLTQGLSIPLVQIDPIGGQYRLPQQTFLDFYKGLTDAFVSCLSFNQTH